MPISLTLKPPFDLRWYEAEEHPFSWGRRIPRCRAVRTLVEDDPNDIALIKLGFSKLGLSNPLVVIPDGEKAIEYLSGQEPYADRERFPLAQLILLDLTLPRRTGFEVLEWVRSQPQLRQVPVIVLTGSTLAVDVRHAYQLGANSFLTKPTDLPELILSLKENDRVSGHPVHRSGRARDRFGQAKR